MLYHAGLPLFLRGSLKKWEWPGDEANQMVQVGYVTQFGLYGIYTASGPSALGV